MNRLLAGSFSSTRFHLLLPSTTHDRMAPTPSLACLHHSRPCLVLRSFVERAGPPSPGQGHYSTCLLGGLMMKSTLKTLVVGAPVLWPGFSGAGGELRPPRSWRYAILGILCHASLELLYLITSRATRRADNNHVEITETSTTCFSRPSPTLLYHYVFVTTTTFLANCDLSLDPSISTTLGTLCSWQEPETMKILRKGIAQGPPGEKMTAEARERIRGIVTFERVAKVNVSRSVFVHTSPTWTSLDRMHDV